MTGRDVEDSGPEQSVYMTLVGLRDEAGRIFGARELLLERVEPEAVVDALVQNAAEFTIAFEN